MGMFTPTPGSARAIPMTPEGRKERELDMRNRYLSDQELDSILPDVGYVIVEPPPSYVPIRTPARKLMATPTPVAGQMGSGFMMQEETVGQTSMEAYDIVPDIPGVGQLEFFKPEGMYMRKYY